MKNFFKDKLTYNQSCNEKVIQSVIDTPEAYSEKARTLICHTLNAHHIWNCRLLGKPASDGVWDTFLLSELKEKNNENYKDSLTILQNSELESVVDYINTRGISYSNSVQDILYHIINHSTYHRGQIITELKSQGIAPIVTDYIFYKR